MTRFSPHRHRLSAAFRRARERGRLRHPALGLLPLLALLGACATISIPSGSSSGRVPSRDADLRRMPPPRVLPVPVHGVRPRQLADTFGAPRSGGRRHEGIDIFARKGTPVLSATQGYVAALRNGGLGGITVTVIGPAGWRHYYAHLSGWGPVRRGQWVEPGTVLGYVGNTGNARTTPPHLHYGVYRDRGGAINPYPLLRNGPGPPNPVRTASTPPRGSEPDGRRVPSTVEEEAKRRAEGLGARILGEILRRAGNGI